MLTSPSLRSDSASLVLGLKVEGQGLGFKFKIKGWALTVRVSVRIKSARFKSVRVKN